MADVSKLLRAFTNALGEWTPIEAEVLPNKFGRDTYAYMLKKPDGTYRLGAANLSVGGPKKELRLRTDAARPVSDIELKSPAEVLDHLEEMRSKRSVADNGPEPTVATLEKAKAPEVPGLGLMPDEVVPRSATPMSPLRRKALQDMAELAPVSVLPPDMTTALQSMRKHSSYGLPKDDQGFNIP